MPARSDASEDDGIGIDDEDRERLSDKGYGKGTGFGLFLIREILAITGMDIVENGRPGHGVRFEITDPSGEWRNGKIYGIDGKEEDRI